ncbi:MAG: DNA primase [Candidatus Marinimicrobia bacterium]|nr:DNA primase [Candidatus Neomarinimicrobiota bacterium]
MPQDQLEEIRKKIDLVELINEYTPLKKTGRNFKALCPFHSEKIPSFVVSPERQIFKCFGCGAGGDCFKFLMLTENMEFSEALQVLAKRAGIKLRRYQPSESEKQKQRLYEINHLASEYYHYLLTKHPAGKSALDYILGRGISRESLTQFKLGYSPNLWEALQDYLVKKKKYPADDLEKAGLVIKSEKRRGYYDRFRGRLMFTLRDQRGNVAGFAGRTLDPKQEEAKYINTPETLLYHKSDLLYGLFETKETIKKTDEALVVEGELDAISSIQVGVENVVAIKGTALTQGQIDLLGKYTQNLVLALDRDLAGDQAAKRGIELADAAGMAIKVVEVKGGKDPDEVAQKEPQRWRQEVKEAVPIYDYYLDSALARFDARTAEGKRKISLELAPILAKINNKVVQAHYLRQLAERLRVEEGAVAAEVAKYVTEESAKPPLARKDYQETEKEKMSRREIFEEYLFALAFQSGNWLLLKKRKISPLVKTPRYQGIMEVLGKYLKRYKTLDSQKLAKLLPAELKEAFDKLYLLELADLIEDEDKLKKELFKIERELRKLGLKETLREISQQIGELERNEKSTPAERKKLKQGQERFRDLSQELSGLEAE